MPTKVLHFKFINRLWPWVYSFGLMVLLVWLAWIILSSTFDTLVDGVLVIAWFMALLVLVLMGYVSFVYWKYRLEFDETHIHLRTPVYFAVRPFTCAYNDIVRVQRGPMRGTLVIVPRNGKPLRLAPGSFEGDRNQILNILAQHVSPGVMEEELITSIWQYTRMDRFFWVLFALVLLFLLILFSTDIGLDVVRGRIAWETVQQLPRSTYVQAFGVSGDGQTIWVAPLEYFTDPVQVQRITPAGIEQWELPALSEGAFSNSPIGFASDANGYPFVIYDEQVLQWTGTEWKTQEITGGEILHRGRGLVISGTQLWALVAGAKNETVLIQMELTTGEQHQVLLSESAVQEEQQLRGIRQSAEESLILWTTDETRSHFYERRDSRWLELASLEPEPETQVVDFAVSPSGVLWTLIRANDRVYTVARWDNENTTWARYSLPVLESALDVWYEGRIEVDAHERIWLPGSYTTRIRRHVDMIRVFEPDADQELRQVIHYTEYNSNYQSFPFSLYYAPDGRLWNKGGKLVWIDTQMSDLPRPLPNWVTALEESGWKYAFKIGFLIINFVFLVFYVFVMTRWLRAGKH